MTQSLLEAAEAARVRDAVKRRDDAAERREALLDSVIETWGNDQAALHGGLYGIRKLEDDLGRKIPIPARELFECELTALGRSVLEPIKAFLNWTLKAFPDIKRA